MQGSISTSVLSFIEKAVIRSWWVVLFSLLCFMVYEQAVNKRDQDYKKLSGQFADLQYEKEKALKKQDELLLQVNSESDPAWVELVLMQGLGLAPEDQTKVFFE
jgi:hypothetical protein